MAGASHHVCWRLDTHNYLTRLMAYLHGRFQKQLRRDRRAFVGRRAHFGKQTSYTKVQNGVIFLNSQNEPRMEIVYEKYKRMINANVNQHEHQNRWTILVTKSSKNVAIDDDDMA